MWELISELRSLLLSPFFYFLTLLGNGFIFICGFLFYHLERDVNPGVHKYLDAIWWSYTTATTTGYGNITPVTDAGKIQDLPSLPPLPPSLRKRFSLCERSSIKNNLKLKPYSFSSFKFFFYLCINSIPEGHLGDSLFF
jgi:hypothetical protein